MLKRLFFLVIISIACLQLYAVEIPAQVIFKSGEEGYQCFRIPAIISASDGSLLAFAEGRKLNCGDAGNIDLVLKKSADGGKTWGPLQVVWDDGSNTCGNPAPVLDSKSGHVVLLSTWNLGEDHEPQIIDQKSKDTRRIFVLRSEDDGMNWSKPQELTKDVKLPEWTWYATGPCNGIQIQAGKYKNRLVIPADHIEAVTKKYYSHVIYSDDGGLNWKLGGTTPTDQVNECTVAELPGGKLLLNMRNYNGIRIRQTATSMDGGNTWSALKGDSMLIEPVCQASMIWSVAKGRKPVLAFSNPASARSRTAMTVKLSYDEGKSWTKKLLLHSGPAAYSNLITLPNGNLACLYESGTKGAYENIVFKEMHWDEFSPLSPLESDPDFVLARHNAGLSAAGFSKSVQYVQAWDKQADPVSGLIPRNIRESKDFWNAWDAAADNYSYMVLVSSMLMPDYFKGRATQMLKAETALTSRIGRLPDSYSFSKKSFLNEKIDTGQIIFGTAEYMKDGLIPLTEWLGESPWSNRMLGMLDDLPRVAKMATQLSGKWYGNSATVEVNGDLMQVLARVYWMTKDPRYLNWAVEIADYYLSKTQLPTVALDHLRIRDHGCEIISGLCEVYLAAAYVLPEKRNAWKPFIHSMLDRILEVGRNQDGLFYDEINPVTGVVTAPRIADNFGYTFNAYWFIAALDSVPRYREAVLKGLSALYTKYRNHNWENGSADGYADAIEGALNLYNREPIPAVRDWLDSEIKIMWNMQQPDGMVEGWHGDGNFARTSMMYSLWKTQGVTALNWRDDIQLGATKSSNGIKIYLKSGEAWSGALKFDLQRHRVQMGMPVDYPRINQFPEWFTTDASTQYRVQVFKEAYDKNRKDYTVSNKEDEPKTYSGKALQYGIPVSLQKGEAIWMYVMPEGK
jgi:hypothetical protein